jgi:uncharacterized protein YndB with AHSA1/START domain
MTEVERTERFPIDADGLWEALTDPELLREWFAPSDGGTVDIDLQPGGTMRFGEGERARTAVVEEVEDGRRLAFTWNDDSAGVSRVEIDVTDVDGGSELHVRESLLEEVEVVEVDRDLHDEDEIAFVPFPIGFQPPRALARA